ncbi:MAG: hypothetical protein EOL98_04780 [Negativicutes bacterium]|nr:hypothetical protein [Negativicutes bacterium]
MLLDLLQKGFGNDTDLNCAEKILYGANWAYDLKLPPEALKLAAGFGGGMGVESTCGAITGGIMVLSHLYVKQRAHECGRIKELEGEFIEAFKNEMGCTDCKCLKEKYRNDEIKCNLVIFKAGEILDRIVAREGCKL